MKDTLKIQGYSVGDSSVGMGACEFSIDLGLYPEDVDKEEREWIIETILRDLWELHDNGDLKFNFSDEMKSLDFDYSRRMSYELSKKILEKK
jgi:hypothetical protein